MSRNVCHTVRSHVLSLHALTITLSFQYKHQAARSNVCIGMSYSVIDDLFTISDRRSGITGRGERYDSTVRRYGTTVRALVPWAASAKKKLKKNRSERCGQKIEKYIKEMMLWAAFCSAWAGFFDLTGPVFLRVRRGSLGHGVCFARAASLAQLVYTGFRAVTTPLSGISYEGV